MAAVGLAPAAYLAGWLAIVAVVVALAWGAWRLRGAVLPDWSGAPARLAEVVLAVAVPVALAQVLGAVGWFSRGPVLVTWVAAGVAMGLIGRRYAPVPQVVTVDPPGRSPREEVVAATVAAALVAAQWTTHAAGTLATGMTHPDTLWYHQPFSARFLQRASFTGLDALGYSESRYFPFNSELVHAVATMPFGRDVLSPLVNLGWGALALLAAWCIGRRRGVGALCVLGAVVVLGVPTLAGTQPGQASNDIMGAALLLTAVALLLEGQLATRPTVVAGIAAGLALGTKLAVAVPVAILTVGIVVLAFRARRRVVAVAWAVPLVATGGYWFVRNWVVADNPLPFFEIRLGPLVLSERAEESGPALISHLTDASMRDQYLPGLWDAFGRGWPVVLALGLGGAVLAVARGRPLERVVGAAALGGVIGYLFTPNTAGLSFGFNLRYLGPTLLLGYPLLALQFEEAGTRWRRAAWITLAALVAVGATAPHRERIEAWPSDGLVAGVLVGVAVLVGAVALMRMRPPARLSAAVAALLLVGVCMAGGWWVQREYLEHRYVDAGLRLDDVNAFFREVSDERVAVFGTVEVYPTFGLDLSNEVTQGGAAGTDRSRDPCREFEDVWRGRYDYVVLTQFGVVFASRPPEEWFLEDANATEIVRDGESVVYKIDGPLHPVACADR